MTIGYFNTEVKKSHHLKVDQTHTLYIEECGNLEGQPVVFLHGGPGGAVSELSRRFFDPEHYRIILFDQRGCGQSLPFLSLENNTILFSVGDLEKIRAYLNIDSWYVFGGSYGSTLALAYAIHYPERVDHLILRGIFLGRQADIDWLFQFGASEFYPKEFGAFKQYVPVNQQQNLVSAYYALMTSEDKAIREGACKAWSDWEGALVNMVKTTDTKTSIDKYDLSLGLLEAHYFANQMFWKEDNYLLSRSQQLKEIPMAIFHGRYDVDCRVSSAYELKKACPHASLNIIELAAHSPNEGPLFEALVHYMDQLRS
ncbi:prolyl aminopeptidase [Fundicoccus ignavus]|uniref:Proline iminopeptidase n=1 Tax=Fundicoccus ignavus TaxID=2664442 RepID=A0A844C160_9LACT|nr:prolyl aminopeptidase [Fundicoccus ignavus]MRJ47904.1 prolyl aminopeptidase [Fundicoccus ignavus]